MAKSARAAEVQAVLAARKRLAKKHPGSRWVGGVLYGMDGEPIPNVKKFPKPGRNAVGATVVPSASKRSSDVGGCKVMVNTDDYGTCWKCLQRADFYPGKKEVTCRCGARLIRM
jgi:hypothetical protein